jgi:hypothetical protein
MKTIAAVCVLMTLGAGSAGAVDIRGKWGIGASVFGGGGEVSLIRGRSERSAWLFDVAATQRYDTSTPELIPPSPAVTTTRRSFSILAGPGYRRFARPTEEFSPYWDLRARGSYLRFSSTSSIGERHTEVGARAEFSIGLEYFTRWRFSVAAHSGLAQLGWIRTVSRQTVAASEYKVTGNSEFASFGLSPSLFVRGYF